LGPQREGSLLTFEGEEFMGMVAIAGKYNGLPFAKVQHQVVTCDVQPVLSTQPQGILVFVNGNMIIDDNENPMKFAQVFHLMPDAAQAGNYYVSSDVFRLNLG
jgi:Nuclear transport factor 2 (NTF2) domain